MVMYFPVFLPHPQSFYFISFFPWRLKMSVGTCCNECTSRTIILQLFLLMPDSQPTLRLLLYTYYALYCLGPRITLVVLSMLNVNDRVQLRTTFSLLQRNRANCVYAWRRTRRKSRIKKVVPNYRTHSMAKLEMRQTTSLLSLWNNSR